MIKPTLNPNASPGCGKSWRCTCRKQKPSYCRETLHIRGNNHELIAFLEVKVGRYIFSSLSKRRMESLDYNAFHHVKCFINITK
jgi:hypothetical protein